VNGFERPEGDPGAVKAAAGELGALGGDLKTQEHALVHGFAAALATWHGPRANTFRDASAGMQAQAKMADNALTNIGRLLQAYGAALQQAQDDIAGLERQAEQRQEAAESAASRMRPDDPEIDRTWQHASMAIGSLVQEAETIRSHLRTVAHTTAAAIDALTDTALPGGATLSPDDIARRVHDAYGVRGVQAALDGNRLTADDAWKALQTPSEALPGDAVEADGEVDWAEVVRDANDKLVTAWTLGTAPAAGWALAQLSRNFVEYTKALRDLPKSYADLSGPGLDVPFKNAEDIDSVLDGVLDTARLTQADLDAFAADFNLARAIDTAGEGGLTGFMAGASHLMSILGVAGDVWTIVEPGVHNETEANALRGAAAANIAGIGAVEFGGAAAAALGLDAAVGWVPVAGQIVVVATGLFLAGDWAYHHWDEVKQWGKDVGHFVTDTVPHALGDAYDEAKHLGSEAVDKVEDLGSGAVHGMESAASTVGGWLGL
jgi:uncharacterized protein YukE